jgi:Asp-tRNA(Asn)/Glu-tRNA(Gln) amidotransferase C subunit
MRMTEMENEGAQLGAVDEATIEQLARLAGITIAPDRLPGAAERLKEMLDFLHQLDELEISEEPPASVFDPSWEIESA